MNAQFYVLTDEFKQIRMYKELLKTCQNLSAEQQKYMFVQFDFEVLKERIQNFYTAIIANDNTIILSHELSERKSIIHIKENDILIEDVESNMLLPLLKRLYRNCCLIEV